MKRCCTAEPRALYPDWQVEHNLLNQVRCATKNGLDLRTADLSRVSTQLFFGTGLIFVVVNFPHTSRTVETCLRMYH